MNKYSIFNHISYEYIETVTDLSTNTSAVLCQNEYDTHFICSLDLWESKTIIETQPKTAKVHNRSTPLAKIELYMSLFRGRNDLYAKRYYNTKTQKSGYVPACDNEWATGLCNKKSQSCSRCPNRSFIPLSDDVMYRHLSGKDEFGRDVIGIYPMLEDETVYFLVIDFDDDGWQQDISAFRDACDTLGIPVSIERSRSGNGAHVWFFFDEPISAATARKFGSGLLTYVMSRHHEIKFSSYDRLLPNQDTLPKGGLGNLIALPLQGKSRRDGNSLFIDKNFLPYDDQWEYLSGIQKITTETLDEWISKLCKNGDLGELEKSEETKPWETPNRIMLAKADFPDTVEIIKANLIYIKKNGISQVALNKIKRLGAFKNPDFYKSQAMRLPTYNKPRIIDTTEETEAYLCIPRGCETSLIKLLDEANTTCQITDKRNLGRAVDITFNGTLRDEQIPAACALLGHETGVLSATTAFGKTVIGANLIATIKVNTLILVHTSTLLDQWKKSLEQFLTINEKLPEQPKGRSIKKKVSLIGQLGNSKNTLSGIVDIAIMQSLFDGNGSPEKEVKEFVKDYGMVICDECHHVSAFSFERVLRTINAKYVYGLTATPIRQDGQHPIIFMQCGPIRYRVDEKEQSKKRKFSHYVIPRFTSVRIFDEEQSSIQDIYREICENNIRNQMIVRDICETVQAGRTPIVLTELKEHALRLSDMLNGFCKNTIVLLGSDSTKEKRLKMEQLKSIPPNEPLIIVATGKYVGEGFDEPRLDTLFLAMPIAWKGTLAQYVGRLHRNYEGKSEVQVYDYVDVHVKVLERMYHKRLRGYAELGYAAKSGGKDDKIDVIFDAKSFYASFAKDIENAACDLLIISPFMRKARVRSFMNLLSVPLSKKATVTIITRPPEDYKINEQPTVTAIIDELKSAGINIMTQSGIYQKYTVIDKAIVWFGSINFLSFSSSEESIMRFENTDIAGELLDISIMNRAPDSAKHNNHPIDVLQ
jgi:superfamily II DNA or RNA helicase